MKVFKQKEDKENMGDITRRNFLKSSAGALLSPVFLSVASGRREQQTEATKPELPKKTELDPGKIQELGEKVKNAVLESIDGRCDIIERDPEAMIIVDPGPIKEYHLWEMRRKHPEYDGAVRKYLVRINFF